MFFIYPLLVGETNPIQLAIPVGAVNPNLSEPKPFGLVLKIGHFLALKTQPNGWVLKKNGPARLGFTGQTSLRDCRLLNSGSDVTGACTFRRQ